jgi:hypothetical protein
MKIENWGAQCCAALWPTTFGPAWPSRCGAHGVVAMARPARACQREVGRGRRCEHRCGTKDLPDKVRRSRAHRSGGATAR